MARVYDALKPIQQQLFDGEFYTGEIDGIWGSGSKAALAAAIKADYRIKLSEHFSLEEFIESDTARKIGNDNLPETADTLEALVSTAHDFELVRTLLGNRAIVLTSGFRNKAVNKAVKGVDTSAHALGFAGDITVAGLTALRVSQILAEKQKAGEIQFDQLIYEKSRKITHLSFDPRLRNEVKTQAGEAGTEVVWGLHP